MKCLGFALIVLGGALAGTWTAQTFAPQSIRLDSRAILAISGAAGAALLLTGSRTAIRQHETLALNRTLQHAVERRMKLYSSRVAAAEFVSAPNRPTGTPAPRSACPPV